MAVKPSPQRRSPLGKRGRTPAALPNVVPLPQLYEFFRPFYDTKKGRIYGLASQQEHIRDGLALETLRGCFPNPEFEQIVAEPGHTAARHAPNAIIVGSTQLFLDPYAYPTSSPTLPMEGPFLGERLERVLDPFCFRLYIEGTERGVRNTITGVKYRPEESDELRIDFGVVRRLYSRSAENTIVLEGVHRLGTFGATMVVTDPATLDVVWNALAELEEFHDGSPIEILVQTSFDPRQNRGLFTRENIRIDPLAIVYDRRWIRDLLEPSGWRDQLPWEVHLRAEEEAAPEPVDPAASARVPRLEVRMDLRSEDDFIRKLCARVFAGAREPAKKDVDLTLERLTALYDRFDLELFYSPRIGGIVKSVGVPDHPLSPVRRKAKRFLVHLALCRFLGRRFRCRPDSILRFVPPDRTGLTEKQLLASIPALKGRMPDRGFGQVLGPEEEHRKHMRIVRDPATRSYGLQLEEAVLDLKLRF